MAIIVHHEILFIQKAKLSFQVLGFSNQLNFKKVMPYLQQLPG
jgi:hypothetical protein